MVWWPTLSISRLRIEKRGDNVTMSVKANGGELHPLGSIKLALREPFYIGLGVCSHNKDAAETAVFSNVEFKTLTPGTSVQAFAETSGFSEKQAP
jgi:hypothetical protein